MNIKSLVSFLKGEGRNEFLSKGIKDCGKSFEKTRRALLKICEQEVEPAKKWEKSKRLLLDNLDSQIPVNDEFVDHFIKLKGISAEDKADSVVFKTLRKYYNIMYYNSFIRECINTVAIYNANDDNTSNIPDNIKVFQFGFDVRDFYYLGQDTTLVRVFLKSNVFREYYLHNKDIQIFYALFYQLVYFTENGHSGGTKKRKKRGFFSCFQKSIS